MTKEETEKLGFREWTTHYEKEQEADREKLNSIVDTVGSLSSIVHRMSASVEALADGQKAVFNRMNRPWQWGAVVAVFVALFSMAAMFGTMATLIVNPINASLVRLNVAHASDVERNLELHMWFRQSLEKAAVSDAETQTDIEWIKKMEERVNRRIHASIGK